MKKDSDSSMYDTVVSNTQRLFAYFFKDAKDTPPEFNFAEVDSFLDNSPTVALIYSHQFFSYSYISPNIKAVTGFEEEDFKKGGLRFAMSLVHPAHSKIYNRYILPVMFKYYALYGFKGRIKDLQFSYTFKIRNKKGDYWWALHHMNAIKTNKVGFPTHTMIHICDVTHMKVEENVNFSVMLKQPDGSSKALHARTYAEDSTFAFSERELEILQLIAQGKTSQEISTELDLSFHTVTTHRKNMMEKSGVNNSSALVQLAYNKGMIRTSYGE